MSQQGPNRFGGLCTVVAGGARGIGASCARRLSAEGASVHILDQLGADPVDITKPDEVDAFFDALPSVPSVAINTVGNANLQPILDQAVSEFRRILDIELTGAYTFLQAAARRMVAGAIAGSITTVSSVQADYPTRGLSGHCAAKAGVDALIRVAAVELGPHGIRVNGVAPGCTLTPLTAPFANLASYAEAVARSTPLGGRMGDPDDVAAAILFLASQDARWVTGRTLAADGGQALVFLPDPMDAVRSDADTDFSSQVIRQQAG